MWPASRWRLRPVCLLLAWYCSCCDRRLAEAERTVCVQVQLQQLHCARTLWSAHSAHRSRPSSAKHCIVSTDMLLSDAPL